MVGGIIMVIIRPNFVLCVRLLITTPVTTLPYVSVASAATCSDFVLTISDHTSGINYDYVRQIGARFAVLDDDAVTNGKASLLSSLSTTAKIRLLYNAVFDLCQQMPSIDLLSASDMVYYRVRSEVLDPYTSK